MNSQKEKIDKIKQVRLLQILQIEIEEEITKYFNNISFTYNLSGLTDDISKIVTKKTNSIPKINLEYDQKSYIFTITLDRVGLRISVANNGYDIL